MKQRGTPSSKKAKTSARRYNAVTTPVRGADPDQSVDEATNMLQNSPLMNVQSSDYNYLISVIDMMYGGWANEMVIYRMKELVKDKNAVGIRNHHRNYLLGLLQNYEGKKIKKLKQVYNKTQKTLGDSINKLEKSKKIGYDGEKKTYTANFGEALDDATEGVVLANYAPIGDSKPQNKQILCRIPRDNVCMSKFVKSLPNSLISELQRNQSDDEKMSSDSSIQRLVDGLPTLRLTDACSIVLGKDDYHGEVDQFVLDARYKDIHEFYMLSLITMGYHAALVKQSHRQNLPILITTANGRDNLLAYDAILFNNEGVFENDQAPVKIFRYVPHGECWGKKMYLLQFVTSRNDGKIDKEVEFDRFGQSLLGFYSSFKQLRQLSYLEGKSRIAYRYSGLDFMTDEERRDLYLARLFFYKSKRLAILLFRGDPKRPRELTVLEGDDAVVCKQLSGDNPSENDKTEFYAKLKKVYYNTCWQSLASAMFGNGPKKCFDDLEQEYKDVYSVLLGNMKVQNVTLFEAKLEGIYEGCAKGGSWGTLASAMFGGGKENSYENLDKSMKELYIELKGETDEEVFEARVRGVYDGRVKGGSWGTLASAMFGCGKENSYENLDKSMKDLYDDLKGETDEKVFEARVRGVYEARVSGGIKGGSWGTLASAMFGDGEEMSRKDLSDIMQELYDELKGTADEKVFVAKVRGVYESRVSGGTKGGSWGTLASAMFGGGKVNSYEDLNIIMKDLYNELKGTTSEEVFEAKVRGVYDGRAKGGSWGTLASAMFGGGKRKSYEILDKSMKELYIDLKGTTDEDVFVARVEGVYEARAKSGTTSFFLRKGAFKLLDGFGDILGSIFANEDDVELSIEDEAKYSRFRHSFDAALILKEGLDKSGELIEPEVQNVFTEIDKVFEKDYATGEKIADKTKYTRWTRFFTRFEKLTGIGLLEKAREADQDDKARAAGRNKFAHVKMFGGGDGDSDSS